MSVIISIPVVPSVTIHYDEFGVALAALVDYREKVYSQMGESSFDPAIVNRFAEVQSLIGRLEYAIEGNNG